MSSPRERITALHVVRPPARRRRCRGTGIADVVVVGGGAVGAATAWDLARRGRRVVVVEQGRPGHSRATPHGALRVFGAGAAHPGLTTEALGLWRELERETGADLLRVTGGIDHGDPERTAQVAALLTAAGRAHRWLEPAEAARRWSGLRFDGPVLHTPGISGRLHTDQALAALSAAAIGRGARIRYATRAEAVEVLNGELVEVGTSAGPVRARRVVIAAGAGVVELVTPSRLPVLRVAEVRGVHVGRRSDVESLSSWPTVTHHLAGGEAVGLAATADCAVFEGGVFDGGVFEGSGAALGDHLAAHLPALDPDRVDPIVRTRTETVDGVFLVERDGPVVMASGFGDHGSTLAPAIGRILAELATGTATSPFVEAR